MLETPNPSRSWQRYELKYVISERQAIEAERVARSHMPPDPYSGRVPGAQYPVHSIYLDSDGRDLLRHTVEKHPRRFKLRVRSYRDFSEPQAGRPMFFEIKQRLDGVVRKTRARLDAAVGGSLLWNDRAEPDLTGLDEPTLEGLEAFRTRQRRLSALPLVGVCYQRQAFESPNADRVRVTFDRELRFGLLSRDGCPSGEIWSPVRTGGVILEIKFTGTYPTWVMDMLHRLNLLRRGVCKYVLCCRAGGLQSPGGRSAEGMRWSG